MKINHYSSKHLFLFVAVCSCLLSLTQCKSTPEEAFKSKGGLRVLVGLDEQAQQTGGNSVEIRNRVMDVLGERIGSYGIIPHIAWQEDKNCILVEIPGIQEPERVLNLLQSNGNLEFWETYNLTDIYSQLMAADERLAELLPSTEKNDTGEKQALSVSDDKQVEEQPEDDLEALLGSIKDEPEWEEMSADAYAAIHPLFSKLQLNMHQAPEGYALVPGPVVGYAMSEDKAKIMEYLNMKGIKLLLPKDLIFKWAVKAMNGENSIYELFALKKVTRDGGAVMDGSTVTEARAESDYSGKYAITLNMNDEGARQWARVTRDNIGKIIAIVVDDKVYSAPRVNDEITGGRSMISGDYTKEEAKDMANMLNSGRMPFPVEIVHYEIVSPLTK